MTVAFQPGYVLPGGDQPLKHARILHANNWKTNTNIGVTASAGTGYDKDALKNSLTYEKYKQATGTSGTIAIQTGDSDAANCIGIAAHTMGTEGVTLSIDSAGSVTILSGEVIADDSPIMVIFAPVASNDFRISWTGGAPEVGVIKIGNALQMQEPFYGGFAPSRTNRQTVVRGNLSEGGEFLGRTKIRTVSQARYEWEHLTAAWCDDDDNLPALIKGIEAEPFFLAWRPGETEDVDFGWTLGPVNGPPTNMGLKDRRTFGFEAKVHGYE